MTNNKKYTGLLNLPKPIDVASAAKAPAQDAQKVVQLVEAQPIKKHADLELAVSWIAAIKKQLIEVETKRKSFTEPLKQVVAELESFFKIPEDSLKASEAALKTKIFDYVDNNISKRDKLLTEISESKSIDTKQKLLSRVEKLEIPKVPGLSVRETKGGEVIDANQIKSWAIENNLLDLLMPDTKAIKAYTKAIDCEIPGWQNTIKKTPVITPKHIK